MNKVMTDKDKRDIINRNVRWIAYNIFNKNNSSHKFVNAFGKLNARFKLDHDVAITELSGGLDRSDYNIFDVLTGEELDMVLESSENLRKMYEDIIVKRNA